MAAERQPPLPRWLALTSISSQNANHLTHLHLCLVVQRVDLVLALGLLLWGIAGLLADALLVVVPERRACGVLLRPLLRRHVRQLRLVYLRVTKVSGHTLASFPSVEVYGVPLQIGMDVSAPLLLLPSLLWKDLHILTHTQTHI